MNIILACNSKESSEGYLSHEYDSNDTIRAISGSLKKLGHSVDIVNADEKAWMAFNDAKTKCDLVFNISEGVQGESRESQIPALLDIYEIPYTGPGKSQMT